jgi:hypothetical protein
MHKLRCKELQKARQRESGTPKGRGNLKTDEHDDDEHDDVANDEGNHPRDWFEGQGLDRQMNQQGSFWLNADEFKARLLRRNDNMRESTLPG